MLEWELFFRLLLSTIGGWFIGLEREIIGKTAGARTFALVALGSTLSAIISTEGFKELNTFNPGQVASSILMGIGFLGAGIIIFREGRVEGLTTAATLWVTAAFGLALGRGLYSLSLFTYILILLLLFSVHWIHPERWRKQKEQECQNNK
jgi:putative Mg2+ transporter-C (MgtC) family protein